MTDASVQRPDLSLVLERITDGFLAIDAQGRITYMNAEARRILRASEDPIGRFWFEAFPVARESIFETEYTRAMRDQIVVQFTGYAKQAGAWLEFKGYPSRDGFSAFFRDVTDRVEAQREIDRNASRQEAIITFGRSALRSQSYDTVLDEGIELVRETLNTNIVDVFDYVADTQSFIVRRSVGWTSGANLDPCEPLTEHLLQVIRAGRTFVSADVRIDSRARSLERLTHCKVLSCLAVLIGTPEAPVGVLAAYCPLPRSFTAADIRFAESIAQTMAESASSFETSRQLTQILEGMRDGFIAVDRDLRVTAANSNYAVYFKRSLRELIGMRLEDLITESGPREITIENVKAAFEAEHGVTFEVLDQGRWFETRLFSFASGVAGYSRDITKRKIEESRVLDLNAELERRVADRTRQLETANKDLESFSYSVSHDLRAPLRAIDGFSQVLSEDYEAQLDSRARGYLDRVRNAAQRMSGLIDALLGMAKVASAPMRSTDVDLSALANDVVHDLREHDPGRSVEVIVEPGVRRLGEPDLMRIALANLFGNAWKFTRGKEHPRIEFGENEAGETYIRDNGAGFDMAYAHKLFGAFQRLHTADEFEGTGIGLATVARIVHRHGGTIRAEGEVGKGATFYITPPRKEQA